MNKKGYTLIELIMVMALLCLFCLLSFTLVQAGAKAYTRLSGDNDGEGSARLALDYLESRIHQSDSKGSIDIYTNPFGEGQALCLHGAIEDSDEDLWILALDGQMVEYYTAYGVTPQKDLSFEVIDIQGFRVQKNDAQLILAVDYHVDDTVKTLERIITVRSSQRGVMG